MERCKVYEGAYDRLNHDTLRHLVQRSLWAGVEVG